MTLHSPDTAARATATDPGFQAFWALRLGFTALPILFGIDKFANWLTDDWTRYLASQFNDITPGDAELAMHLVGAIEIVAGIAVLLLPRLGGPLVAVWLGAIIVNLLMVGGYGDIALRDVGLMLAAIVLGRLAWAYPVDLPVRRG